jgi:hypothetical protein
MTSERPGRTAMQPTFHTSGCELRSMIDEVAASAIALPVPRRRPNAVGHGAWNATVRATPRSR